MRPRELFGVAVRVLGVWFWAQAAYWGYWYVVKVAGTGAGNPNVPAHEDLASMILYLLLGTFFIAGARFIVWIGYGDALQPTQSGDPPSGGAK